MRGKKGAKKKKKKKKKTEMVMFKFLTHVGQSAASSPVELAGGQGTIRVTGGHVSISPADEFHGDRAAADRLETVDYFQDGESSSQAQIIRQPTCKSSVIHWAEYIILA